MKKYIIITAILALPIIAVTPLALANQQYGPYHATVTRVLDGDTIDVTVKTWPQQTINTRIRIHGIDTPEKRTRRLCEKTKGLAATAWAQQWFAKHPTIIITNLEFGKYAGRLLANVKTQTGTDYAQTIIASGHAAPYVGKTKRDWCAPQTSKAQ